MSICLDKLALVQVVINCQYKTKNVYYYLLKQVLFLIKLIFKMQSVFCSIWTTANLLNSFICFSFIFFFKIYFATFWQLKEKMSLYGIWRCVRNTVTVWFPTHSNQGAASLTVTAISSWRRHFLFIDIWRHRHRLKNDE